MHSVRESSMTPKFMACVFGCSCCFLRVVGLGKIRNLDLGKKNWIWFVKFKIPIDIQMEM